MWFDSYNFVMTKYDICADEFQHDIKIIKRGILIDTAPLFILIVGYYDSVKNTTFVERFQCHTKDKNQHYIVKDYDYLKAFLNSLNLEKFNLYITPHIFTEVMKHIWGIVDNPEQFQEMMEMFLESKWYVKEEHISFNLFCCNEDYLKKKLEIGDISISILANNNPQKYIALLTDDMPFALIADKKYDLLVLYYTDIRNGTFELNPKKIPAELLEEPVAKVSE